MHERASDPKGPRARRGLPRWRRSAKPTRSSGQSIAPECQRPPEEQLAVFRHEDRSPAPVRLKDYRPADFLIETVDLDFRLDPTATRVTARLRDAPNSAAGTPLVLVGDELMLVSVALDGAPLPPDRYDGDAERADHPAASRTRRSTLEIVTEINPAANTKLMGLYRSERQLLHAVRGGRLPPHHLFPRPARRARGLHHADRGAEGGGAGPARQRQPRRAAATSPAATGTSRSGTIRSRSRPTSSRWSPATSASSRTASPPCRAARSRSASTASTARRRAAPMRWIR